jgi:hypothetical protein
MMAEVKNLFMEGNASALDIIVIRRFEDATFISIVAELLGGLLPL